MDLILSIAGIAISLLIAWWEYRRANKAEAMLEATFKQLPGQLVSDLSRLLQQPPEQQQGSSTLETRYADLNGDGKDELLVSFLSGPHNTALQVFGMKSHWEFGLLDELYSSTPTEFELEDIDGDGIPEISTVEVAQEPDLPYVMGLRDRVSYKLTSDGFAEVRRIKCYSPEDLEKAMQEWRSTMAGGDA